MKSTALSALTLIFSSLGQVSGLATPQDEAYETVADYISSRNNLNTLADLLNSTALLPVLNETGPFTLFAPRNGAFNNKEGKKLADPEWSLHLIDVLTYHVTSPAYTADELEVNFTTTMLNMEQINITGPNRINDQVTIAGAEYVADNGIVHMINKLLLPPSAETSMLEWLPENGFTELAKLVEAAGINVVLAGDGPLTLFAPTNAAIKAMGEETIDALMTKEGVFELSHILQYHLVSGNAYAVDFDMMGQNLTTVNGDDLEISLMEVMMEDYNMTIANATGDASSVSKAEGGNGKNKDKEMTEDDVMYMVKINDRVNVEKSDVLVSNGVIHVIDTVMVPRTAVEDASSGGWS